MRQTTVPLQKPHDGQEFNRLQRQLDDWSFHEEALELSRRHAGHCLFFLGHVGCGRIETDILNTEASRLSLNDLVLAVGLNALADACLRQGNVPHGGGCS